MSKKQTIQPQILEISGGKSDGIEVPGKKFSEKFGIPRKFVLFLEFSENAVPFISGNFWNLKPEFLVKWNAPTTSVLLNVIYECKWYNLAELSYALSHGCEVPVKVI